MSNAANTQLRKVTHYIAVSGRAIHTCRTCGVLDTIAPNTHSMTTGHVVTSGRDFRS